MASGRLSGPRRISQLIGSRGRRPLDAAATRASPTVDLWPRQRTADRLHGQAFSSGCEQTGYSAGMFADDKETPKAGEISSLSLSRCLNVLHDAIHTIVSIMVPAPPPHQKKTHPRHPPALPSPSPLSVGRSLFLPIEQHLLHALADGPHGPASVTPPTSQLFLGNGAPGARR